MTDERVIKAWKKCIDEANGCCGDDTTCPYCREDENIAKCFQQLRIDILNVIKRQQAEIERLKEIANPKCQQCVEQTRKNSIVEVADEIKHRMLYWSYDFQYNSECIAAEREIDDIVKEMTEGSDGE